MDSVLHDLPVATSAVNPRFICTPKGVQAADEMLRIADNLQRG
jgi:hypothetical protein